MQYVPIFYLWTISVGNFIYIFKFSNVYEIHDDFALDVHIYTKRVIKLSLRISRRLYNSVILCLFGLKQPIDSLIIFNLLGFYEL